jgi:hypothetical protein
MNFEEVGGTTNYGDARYDAEKLTEWLNEVKNGVDQLTRAFEYFHVDTVLDMDIATKAFQDKDVQYTLNGHSSDIEEDLNCTSDDLCDLITHLNETVEFLKTQPKYNALDKETQEEKEKMRKWM